MPTPDNNYARWTNHDYIGSFGRIPNEPKSILISNYIWEKVKNKNNFSLNKKNNKKKKLSSPTPFKKPKSQEVQKHKLPPIPKHSDIH